MTWHTYWRRAVYLGTIPARPTFLQVMDLFDAYMEDIREGRIAA